MLGKTKKQPYERVFKDRFLRNEKPDNLYVTCFLYFLVFFLCFLLIFVSFVSMCKIEGTSMLNTLSDKQHVLLLNTKDFSRGDVIVVKVYDSNEQKDKLLIKRVIGLAGDKVGYVAKLDNKGEEYISLYVKQKGSDTFIEKTESYIKEPMSRTSFPSSVKICSTVEELSEDKNIYEVIDKFFYFLGDNRNVSLDSRYYKGQPADSVVGKMILPLDKNSLLERFFLLVYGNPHNGV